MATIVMLHGGAMGAWVWRPVEKLLRELGHETLRITYTGFAERRHHNSQDITPQTHVADVVNTLFFEDVEDCVVLAHSYSGTIVPGVAKAVPERIRQAIYLDALVVRAGECTNEAMGFMDAELCADIAAKVRCGEAPIYSGVDAMQREGAKTTPFRMSAERQEWLLAHLSDMPTMCTVAPVLVGSESMSLPVDYIACTDTIMEPMAARARELGWPVHALEGDHAVLVGDPENTVALVDRLIK